MPDWDDRWAARLLPATPELFPLPPHLRPKQHSRVLGHSPLFRQPPNILPQQPRQPQLRSLILQEACVAWERVSAQELPGREEEEDMGEESPVQPRGTPRPLRTVGIQGLQPQTPCTHLANCVQSAAPARGEPPRTRSHGHSHSPMVQVGSPSSCQTEARDPGVPVVLQRPPASQPLCSHPRGAHVARPKVAKAQGISALLQPPCSAASRTLGKN